MKLTEEQKERFTAIGKHYGYPECCIEAFLVDVGDYLSTGKTGNRSEVRIKQAIKGFVPCEAHAMECRDNPAGFEPLKDLINKHRRFPFSFPLDMMDLEMMYKACQEEFPILQSDEEPCICAACTEVKLSGAKTPVSKDNSKYEI